jgi:hypothetical protein
LGEGRNYLDRIVVAYGLDRGVLASSAPTVNGALELLSSNAFRAAREIAESASRLRNHGMRAAQVDDFFSKSGTEWFFSGKDLLRLTSGASVVLSFIGGAVNIWNGIGVFLDDTRDNLSRSGGVVQIIGGTMTVAATGVAVALAGLGVATLGAALGAVAPFAIAASLVGLAGYGLENHAEILGGIKKVWGATEGFRESAAEAAKSLWNGVENAWSEATGFVSGLFDRAQDVAFSTAEQIRSLLAGPAASVQSQGAIDLPDPAWVPVTASLSFTNWGSWRRNVPHLFDSNPVVEPEKRRFNLPLFGSTIAYQDIAQGSLGDCWFIAAVMGIARDHPDVLRRMIRDNGNGTYTVTFADGATVTVDGDLYVDADGQPVYGKTAGSREMWLPILEKAYAIRGTNKGVGYAGLESNKASRAFVELTGKGQLFGLDENVDTVWTWLNRLHWEQSTIVVGSKGDDDTKSVTTEDGARVHLGHAYLVAGIHSQGGNRYLELLNPWNDPSQSGGARIRVRIEDFAEHFRTVHVLKL